jgi:hypothetical protein
VCIFVLKEVDSKKLKATFFAFFNKGFIEDEVEERAYFFKRFNIILFVFLLLLLSLLLSFLLENFSMNSEVDFLLFCKIFIVMGLYFILKWFLEFLISRVFLIRSETRFYLISKVTYLYAITFVLYIAVILVMYTPLNSSFLGYFTVGLFSIRFAYHVANNKNLILSKLFYFILYLCAFEIAPLFVLFKLML